ncbi:MAG TPA: Flp pilus assembly protein CpaB [Planktothrix sp.]|jgi:pilus assembly protein CpaB
MPALSASSTTAPSFNWEKANASFKQPARKRNPFLLIAVVATIVLAVSGVWRAMHTTKPMAVVKVLSAAHDLPAGAKIGFTSVKFNDVPKIYVTPDMVTSLSWASGRTTRTFVAAGEPLRADDIFANRHGVAGTLESYERAITLQLPDDALVDHSIAPDDLVDALVVTTKDGKKYTKTVSQLARVLVVACKEQSVSRHNSNAANKITLAVAPDLAESLTEAAEAGKVRLILRNRLSRTQSRLAGVGEDDLLPASAFAKKSPWQVAQPAPAKVERVKTPTATIAPPPPLVPTELSEPLQWMVDVFSGSKKESYGVSAR